MRQAASPASPARPSGQPGPLSQEPLFTSPDIQLEGDVMESSPESLLRPIFFLPFQGFCFFLRLRKQAHTLRQFAENISKTSRSQALPWVWELPFPSFIVSFIQHTFLHVGLNAQTVLELKKWRGLDPVFL